MCWSSFNLPIPLISLLWDHTKIFVTYKP
jgi:hypothetical protein